MYRLFLPAPGGVCRPALGNRARLEKELARRGGPVWLARHSMGAVLGV